MIFMAENNKIHTVSFDVYEQVGYKLHNATSWKVNTVLDLKMRTKQQMIRSL